MTAYDDALAAWKLTPEYVDCQDLKSLHNARSPDAAQRYLDARLSTAFAAAWDMHAALVAIVVDQHCREPKLNDTEELEPTIFPASRHFPG